MTSINSSQDIYAAKRARQLAAEMAASSQNIQPSGGSFPSFAPAASEDSAKISNGTLQPPLAAPTVNALLAMTEPANGSLSEAATSKNYKHLADDEKDLPVAVKDFLEYNRKSPAEKMRDAILKELGLTEDDLAKMSPEDRAKAEDQIAAKLKERIKQEMEKKAENPGADALSSL